jgi:sensor histidine kinase YesM
MFNPNFNAMKSKLTLLFFLLTFIQHFCFAGEVKTLPEEPWHAIVFMEKNAPDFRWKGDISIKLFGSYTQTDSLMIENSIKVLNELCETVKLSITEYERGNLEIVFLDSINKNEYESVISLASDQESSWTYNFRENKGISHFELALHRTLVPEKYRQNFLTNTLALALYPKFLDFSYTFKNGREIYKRPISVFASVKPDGIQPFYLEFGTFDRQLIEAVYATNFTELLTIAKKQFPVPPAWLLDNSRTIMVFPLVLALFLVTGLIILFYKKLGVKIQNKLLQFNVISLLALLSVGILSSLYFVTSEKLGDPYFSFFNMLDLAASILISLIIGLPALNIFRLIELAIHRKTHYKYFKVLLIFLSTSLIPSGTILSIAYFSFKKDINNEGIMAMIIVFMCFIIIGIIRALISFFILNEKEIKNETEVKIANLRELKTKAEMNALHSRINPHFLYNSLNSIAGLAHDDADKTEHMALSLSKLFRYSINKDQSDWTTFKEELEMVKIYLDVEKVRFDDRLDYSVELPTELENYQIPRFIIQPLVENAVKHGISKSVESGQIKVAVSLEGCKVFISVSDDGPAFPNDLLPGFGIQSIYDKLEILYKDKFEMNFINSPQKQVLIKLN